MGRGRTAHSVCPPDLTQGIRWWQDTRQETGARRLDIGPKEPGDMSHAIRYRSQGGSPFKIGQEKASSRAAGSQPISGEK